MTAQQSPDEGDTSWSRRPSRSRPQLGRGPISMMVCNSHRTWTELRPVCSADVIEYGLALLIDKAGEQLLSVPKDQRPGEDLRGRVQRAEARDELATHEQQAQEGGD